VCNPLGSPAARAIANDADLVIWVGCKIGQNTSLNWTLPRAEQATIHLDSDPAELGRTFRPTVALNGDVRAALDEVLLQLPDRSRPEWVDAARGHLERFDAARLVETAREEAPVQPARLMRELSDRLGPTDVVISDASFAAGWISTYLPGRAAGRNFLFARGLGGLGYSVGAALGAAAARPADRIVTVSGDGGFGFQLAELATQAQEGHRTVNIVLNNGTLGWFAMWEELFFNGLRQSVDLQGPDGRPDYAEVARGLGCSGFRVDEPEEVAAALDAAFSSPTSSVVDVRIDPRATPIEGYRRRLAAGGSYPRQGTVYGRLPWSISPDVADAPAAGTATA
jgi:acetolactate synthase-1/2/3 large subunit